MSLVWIMVKSFSSAGSFGEIKTKIMIITDLKYLIDELILKIK